MPEQTWLPDSDEAADWEQTGTVLLARAALLAPSPAPDGEHIARERALAQFREAPPSLRTLRPEDVSAHRGGAHWVRRLLRRLMGK